MMPGMRGDWAKRESCDVAVSRMQSRSVVGGLQIFGLEPIS